MKALIRSLAIALLLATTGLLVHAAVPEQPRPLTPKPASLQREARSIYETRSRGWYWVYESVAHAQSFVAQGPRIHGLWLRPAQLNATRPASPLRVEVRDSRLQRVLAQGHIKPEDVDRGFRWVPVELTYRAPLTAGASYVLLLQSPDTGHEAPWVVNAVYKDVYGEGRHIGYADDLLFRMTFATHEVRVGPPANADMDTPVNSGLQAAPARHGPATLAARFPRVPEAANDPIGAIPRGLKELVGARAGD